MLGPIFTRELATVPRKRSHYAARVAQLGLLTILGITAWQASVGFTSEQDFNDWCSTFTWEERQLDQEDQCASRQAVIDGGDCAAWYTAWGDTQ